MEFMHAVSAMREEVHLHSKPPSQSLVSKYCSKSPWYRSLYTLHDCTQQDSTLLCSVMYFFFFFLEISDIPDRTVTLGTNTTFTCSATGPGDIFYRWNRTVLNASGVLTEIGFYNESRVRGQHTSTLIVINVGVRDRGHYTCFVSFNSTNTRDRTAILSTHGE